MSGPGSCLLPESNEHWTSSVGTPAGLPYVGNAMHKTPAQSAAGGLISFDAMKG